MKVRSRWAAPCGAATLLVFASAAAAHVSIASGPAYAGGRAVVTFGIGHGCEGADTIGIDVAIPPEVTAVRGVPNTFGPADVQVDDTGAPTNVVWTKDSIREADDQYYEMQIRISVPDTPFSVLHFKVTQTCRDKDDMEYTTEWSALPGDEPPEGEDELPPAAGLVILPARTAGWNKYTVDADIDDLTMYFSDAQIVWSGDAAYSPNAAIAEMIEDEDDVDTLEAIDADSEIWVKY